MAQHKNIGINIKIKTKIIFYSNLINNQTYWSKHICKRYTVLT
jgi:hypothetical protein